MRNILKTPLLVTHSHLHKLEPYYDQHRLEILDHQPPREQPPISITWWLVNGNNNVDDKLKTANDVSNVLNFFGGFRLFAVTTFL